MTGQQRQVVDMHGKRVAVAGAARSGVAAAEFLVGRGAHVTLSDVKTELPAAARLESLGIRLELGGHRRETFTDADLVVVSPGVPPELPVLEAARQRGVPILSLIHI